MGSYYNHQFYEDIIDLFMMRLGDEEIGVDEGISLAQNLGEDLVMVAEWRRFVREAEAGNAK